MSDLVEVKKIGEVERIVHASGLWDGTGPVEFSNDGTAWAETWAPTEDHPLPEFARVEVYRKEVRIPTRATIRWDEQIPQADPFWTAKWVGAPMRHFGRTVRMVGFRQTFRDLLGDIVIEDEEHTDRPDATPADAAPAHDWAAEIAEAQSLTLLEQIEKDGRAARVFSATPEGTALWRALRDRKKAVAADVADPWSTPPIAATVEVPEIAATIPAEARRAPQDHLPPTNRAARRAKAKGRRK